MLQIDPRSAMNLDNMSTGGHHARWLPPRPLEEKSKQPQASGVKGMGIILIERVLPRARDRLVTIHADALLTEAAELLFAPSCRMVVVCDPAGVMIGVITRTDIIRQFRHWQGSACATRCVMIMTRRVIACRPDDRLDEIWTAMNEKELHSIPVVDAGRRPLGLLSARDALEALLASVEYEGTLLRDYVMGIGYH
jgi:CBS domain-containing protein